MKKTHIYSCAVVLLVIALLISFLWNKKQQELSLGIFSPVAGAKSNIEIALRDVNQVKKHSQQKVNTFIEEMSRELCKQEDSAIREIVWPDVKTINSLKPGDVVPESNVLLSPAVAISVLKRMAVSKCSSFYKDNFERFLTEFVLTDQNFHEFQSQLYLTRRNGFDTYKLIKKAIESLEKTTGEQATQLRTMILYSLKTLIKDAHSSLDVSAAVSVLRDVREKGLISYPTNLQIEMFQQQVEAASKKQIKESQQLIAKYFPLGIGLNLTAEEIVNAYGYQGIKEELEKDRRDFKEVREFARQLDDFVGENF